MRLGIISDTHNHLPEAVFTIFESADCILHAGDIGDISILHALERICSVYAVHGNIDSWKISRIYPRTLLKEFAGINVFMIHDIVNEKYMRFELFKNNIKANLVIHGHTHIPSFIQSGGIYFLNPGSPSSPKSGKKGTIVNLDLKGKEIHPDFIELS